MANIEKLLTQNNFAVGAVIGLGAAVITPLLLPLLGKAMRPVAKGVIKAGIIMVERGRETAAELGELVEDAVAEARAEMHPHHPQGFAGGMATGAAATAAAATVATPAAPRTEPPAANPESPVQG